MGPSETLTLTNRSYWELDTVLAIFRIVKAKA